MLQQNQEVITDLIDIDTDNCGYTGEFVVE